MGSVAARAGYPKQVFRVRRVEKGVLEATAVELGLLVHGRSLDQLRANIAAALLARTGENRSFAMTVGHENSVDIRPGERFVLTAQPPEKYAGTMGARAVVVSSSEHVCVQFESGLRESFPQNMFGHFFEHDA